MRTQGLSKSLTAIGVGVIVMLVARAGFAAQSVFPVQPIFVPPTPCISTGPIYEFPKGCYTCQVRNVSPNTYGATINMVNEENQSEVQTPPVNLTAGRTIETGFCTTGGFLRVSCVVTTQTGTVAALGDLAVTEEFAPGIAEGGLTSTAPSAALTEGKIYPNCATSSGTANGD